jgi:hypothetical protein
VKNKEIQRQLEELEEGYRKQICLVENEKGQRRPAWVYYGDTVTFDKRKNLMYVPSGDLKQQYDPATSWVKAE